MADRLDRNAIPSGPVYVISVAASIVSAHPRTLRIYEDEGLALPGPHADQHPAVQRERHPPDHCGSAT